MSTAPLAIDEITDALCGAHAATLDALGAAVGRSAQLWRQVETPNAPVPGLAWTAAETAAHVVGDLGDHVQAISRYTNGYVTHAQRPAESPSRLSAVVNAHHLDRVPERDMRRLADMLQETAATYIAAAASVEPRAAVPTPNGLVIHPPVISCLLLGEQLVHGLDIARAAQAPWPISREDALLVVPGVLSVAPHYLQPRPVQASYELRMRGGGRYRIAVADGEAVVTGAGEQADCVITADPVAFLLLGYGRVSEWAPVLRRRIRAGGRKPWLALKFRTLMYAP
jgi:hypothetical protein